MKKLTKVLVAALATVTLGVSLASPTSAATVNYVDYDKTTETIRKDIKQGKPTEADLQAGSQVTYVYKKNGTCGVSVPKQEKELPSTGTVENTITLVFSILFVAGGLYLVKSNKFSRVAKTVLALGGAGAFLAAQVEVLAADSSILGQVVEQNDLTPEQVDCYDYVGYYIASSTTTQEETTSVTTEETTETTTESTTSTESTTTTEATTTTTEEPTTQTEATTQTETITVAPIDYL
jgi:mucin-like glycoprotein 900, putative